MDHYQTLGVSRSASAEEIKQAYRRQAARHHPDRGGNTADFQKIEEAYRILSDPASRAQYDNPSPQFENFHGFQGGGFDFDSIFNMFGARFHQQTRPQARIQVELTLQDILKTTTKILQVNTPQGSQTIEITVPAGLEDGDTMQYAGVAPGGLDLVVIFRIRPDARYVRKGNNLITQVNVTFWELIAGTQIPIQTITGERLDVDLPSMTRPEQQLRLRGKGLPDRNGTLGDLIIRFNAILPESVPVELMNQIRDQIGKP